MEESLLRERVRTFWDKAQERLKIDCADFLAGQLRLLVEESVMREYQRQIRDLKVNYLAKVSESSAGKEA